MGCKPVFGPNPAREVRPPVLEFTGERIVPGKTSEDLFREHEERYVFAGRYVPGRDVLDVACGTGIGTQYLRKAGALRCSGLDIDPQAIEYARTAYEGCTFIRGDAAEIELADSSVDVVVSFETIEHVREQRKFLLECKRVLRMNGLLVCSTPNRTTHRWQGSNPYHVHELTAEEFADLLATYFGKVRLFAQSERLYPFYVLRRIASRASERLRVKTAMKRLLGWETPAVEVRREFAGEGEGLDRAVRAYKSSWLRQPMYVIAVAQKVSD
jgi:2-polyprenyl-3-methyl-5-hydroxy-6-metoxy-1,4-benzoquinol methylase